MSEETGAADETAADDTAKPPVKKTPARKRTSTAKAATKSSAAKKTTAAKKTGTRAASAKAPSKSTTKTTSSKPSSTSSKPSHPSGAASTATTQPGKTAPVSEEPTNKGDAGQDTADDQVFTAAQERDWAGDVKRGAFMLLFGFLGWLAMSTGFTLAALQFLLLLITGKHNETIQSIVVLLGRYVGEVMDYLSFKTDTLPFPLGSDLPSGDD